MTTNAEERACEVLEQVSANMKKLDWKYRFHMMNLGAFHGAMSGLVFGSLLLVARLLWM